MPAFAGMTVRSAGTGAAPLQPPRPAPEIEPAVGAAGALVGAAVRTLDPVDAEAVAILARELSRGEDSVAAKAVGTHHACPGGGNLVRLAGPQAIADGPARPSIFTRIGSAGGGSSTVISGVIPGGGCVFSAAGSLLQPARHAVPMIPIKSRTIFSPCRI